MSEPDFADLVNRARAGEEAAREAFYVRALRLARQSARRYLGKRDRTLFDSQDVQQSILIRLHRRLPDLVFSEEGELAAWLLEATRRVLKEKRRNAHCQKRDVDRTFPFPTAGLPDRHAGDVERLVARITVEEFLGGLSPDAAEVVRLHALEGCTFEEVAERLGLPGAEAARKRYARALVRLGGLARPPDADGS